MLVATNMDLSMLALVGLFGGAKRICLKNLFSILTTSELISPHSLSISPKVQTNNNVSIFECVCICFSHNT